MLYIKTKFILFFLFGPCFLAYAKDDVRFSSAFCSVTSLFEKITEIKVNRRNIYGLFTPHSLFYLDDLYKMIIYSEDLNAELKELIAKNHRVVDSKKKDISIIVRFLRYKPTLRWIGLEASPEEFTKGMSIQELVIAYEEEKEFLRKILSSEDVEKILHIVFSSYIIAISEYPELFKNIKFIPIDNHFYKMEGVTLINQIEKTRHQIIEKMVSAKMPFAKFAEIDSMREEALETIRVIPKSKMQIVLENLQQLEISRLVASYFSSINQFIKSADQRSKTMSTLSWKQPGEGLIIVGSAHRKKVLTTLLSMCRGL